MQSPAIEPAAGDNKNTGRIVAVYPETKGFSSKQIRALLWPLLGEINKLQEILPLNIVKTHKLMSFGQALAQIHFPENSKLLVEAKRRLAFEELFFLITASLRIKTEIQVEIAPKFAFNRSLTQKFLGALDFSLTSTQKRAAWQILQDLAKAQPMNRLLEGDVGSGKTIVAILASIMVLDQGYQTVLMVPTEILASQHFAKIAPLLKQLGYSCELVLGGQAKDVKLSAKHLNSVQIRSFSNWHPSAFK